MTGVLRFLPALCAIVCAVFFLSCSAGRFDSDAPIAPGDVVKAVNERNAKILSLIANGKIAVDTPELANSGGISIKLQKPDTLLLEINGPFGLNVGKGLITNKRFTFYNGLDNTVMQGATTSKNLRNVLRVSIEFRDILEILSGTMGFARKPPHATETGARHGNDYTLTYSGEGETYEYTVDLKYEAVKKFVHTNGEREIVEEIAFRDFRKKSDLYLPYMISVKRPVDEENLTLVYDRQTINELPIDFQFKVPSSATKINF